MNNDICFKIQIVDECNLNCKGCDHFAPLAKKWHEPLNDYINMIKTLKEQSKGKIKELIIYGGEPLLHEDLPRILLATSVLFPNTLLCVETNGILVNDFIQKNKTILNKINITWKISEYLSTLGIVDKIKQQNPNINMEYAHQDVKDEKESNKYLPYKTCLFKVNINPINVHKNKQNNYNICYCKHYETNSLVIRNWKVNRCPITACIDILNNNYVDECESIDLHNHNCFDDLLHLANNPCTFCGRCGLIEFGIPYGISEKSESEWMYEKK